MRKDTHFFLINNLKKRIEYFQNCLKLMAEIYAEKRTDVQAMALGILSGKIPDKKDTEHRYIFFTHNEILFQYDTLTTLVYFKVSENVWEEVKNIQYED
jgi:hypothetical protein